MSTIQNGNGSNGDSLDGMNRQGRRIQEIIEQIDAMPNPSARILMHECMESVLAFYGEGLERILKVSKRSTSEAGNAFDDLVNDPVVGGLLLIHGLHPYDLPTRLRAALDKVRPYMESHGGNVELLGIENDFARLRLQGSCKSCPSSSVTLELAVRHALEEACPDLVGFAVEGMPAAELQHVPNTAPAWVAVPEASQIVEGAMAPLHAGDAPLIVCKVQGQLYAYRDHCPACNMPLHLGALDGEVLGCSLGHRYDVPRAGRALGGSSQHLDPLPLLVRDGAVQVALPREKALSTAPGSA
jgi:Fe-S cluster biogenesis protein NfuA/nitrite reductase/ring-hydroxylating ferredoxin subunit